MTTPSQPGGTGTSVAEVLAAHRWEAFPSPVGLCSCGGLPPTREHFGHWVEVWRAHVEDALRSAGLLADSEALAKALCSTFQQVMNQSHVGLLGGEACQMHKVLAEAAHREMTRYRPLPQDGAQ